MAMLEYPSGLPEPQLAPTDQTERRDLTDGYGPREARAFQRDTWFTQRLQIKLKPAQAAIFKPWIEDTLIFGGCWFASNWSIPPGGVAVRRFIMNTQAWSFLATGHWLFSIDCDVRGRGELPETTAAALQTSTWNPADKDAGVTLSNGDRTASKSTSLGGVRGETSNAAGVHQFEVTISGDASQVIGLGRDTADILFYPGSDLDSWGYLGSTGEKVVAGFVSAFGDPYGPGDVVGIVYIAATGDMDVYLNGVLQGSVPTAVTAALFPMWGAYTPSLTASATLNTGETTFAHAVGGASDWG